LAHVYNCFYYIFCQPFICRDKKEFRTENRNRIKKSVKSVIQECSSGTTQRTAKAFTKHSPPPEGCPQGGVAVLESRRGEERNRKIVLLNASEIETFGRLIKKSVQSFNPRNR
jgi:hypothetical protein